jgi:hypothetical protein
MDLETEADGRSKVSSLDELRSRLARLDPANNSFVILEKDKDTYIQAAAEEDGFIIERQDGSFARHFYAARPGLQQALQKGSWLIPQADRGQDRFSLEEMVDMFSAYFSGSIMPSNIAWIPMQMSDPRAFSTKLSRWSRIAIWVIGFAVIAGVTLWLKWKRYHP